MASRHRIDSRDLTPAAAAWQAPKIIIASVFAGVTGLVFLFIAAFLMKNSPVLNRNAELRMQFLKKCTVMLTDAGVDSYKAHDKCTVQADEYRQTLESGRE
jgi:hypothetical protein